MTNNQVTGSLQHLDFVSPILKQNLCNVVLTGNETVNRNRLKESHLESHCE